MKPDLPSGCGTANVGGVKAASDFGQATANDQRGRENGSGHDQGIETHAANHLAVPVEARAKPAQRAETARERAPRVGERDRREIIRHALRAAMQRVSGEISSYVSNQMAGRFSEKVIDDVIVTELLVRDRQVSASRVHAQGHLQMLRELELDTRAELRGRGAA